MIFKEINEAYYKLELEKYQAIYKANRKTVIGYSLAIIVLIIITITSFYINDKNQSDGLLILALISMTICIYLILFIFSGYLPIIKRALKMISELNEVILYPPILTIEEDSSVSYQTSKDKIQYLDRIEGFRVDDEYPRSKGIFVPVIKVIGVYQNIPSNIIIIGEYKDKETIKKTFKKFETVIQQRQINNDAFKDKIDYYREHIEEMLSDIKEMNFLMGINKKETQEYNTGFQLYLDDAFVEANVFVDEEDKKYICLYSSMKETIDYKEYIDISYKKILNMIVEATSSIYKNKDIDGIIINKNTDAIKISVHM